MASHRYANGRGGRGRAPWLIATAAALLAAALAFTGGRLTAPRAAATPPAGPATASSAGPARTLNDVPVGYAHSRAGAVRAAANYERVLAGALLAEPDRYRLAVQTMADPAAEADLLDTANRSLQRAGDIAPGLTQAVAQGTAAVEAFHPLWYHVDSYTAERAVISIWGVLIQAVDGEEEPTEAWSTEAVTVRWAGDDWKLFREDDGQYGGIGPSPRSPQPPPQVTALPPQLRDFEEYGDDLG